MSFGIPKEGFWGQKELSYQHVHMFWAFWMAYAMGLIFPFLWIYPLTGFLCGAMMESYQYRKYIEEQTIPRTWLDSLRDLCFWVLGSCLNYILIFTRGLV